MATQSSVCHHTRETCSCARLDLAGVCTHLDLAGVCTCLDLAGVCTRLDLVGACPDLVSVCFFFPGMDGPGDRNVLPPVAAGEMVSIHSSKSV